MPAHLLSGRLSYRLSYRIPAALRLATVAGLLSLSGCAAFDPSGRPEKVEPTYEAAAQSDFINANYKAAEVLIAQFAKYASEGTMIVATVVNIDSLEHSSTLGRLVSEQVAARFGQRGYTMVEMKFRNQVYMKRNEGELLLTREISEVARQHQAQAVIVGSYGVSSDTVFINIKVVQPGTNTVLAAHDYALPLNRDVRSMLHRSGGAR